MLDITQTKSSMYLFQDEQIETVSDLFDMKCPQCGDSLWLVHNVMAKKHKSHMPLTMLGVKCSKCGSVLLIPTLSIVLKSLSESHWSH
jgi:ribosomal protein S27E